MTAKRIGPWTVHSEKIAFENPWIRVEDHRVAHPDGSPGEYGVVRFKHLAIGVLPVDADGFVWLVGQHRYPHDDYSWELPEGGGALYDDPLQSAKRELGEETGLRAACWRELARFSTSNSVTDEKAIAYLAWDLSPGRAAPEPSEDLALRKVKFHELLEMVMSGEVTDSLTIIMTLSAHVAALRGDAPEPISNILCADRATK
ncbi:MAG: NUDIX hydrolase [Pseudomonadota bacterium]